jgi:hypothetical protein
MLHQLLLSGGDGVASQVQLLQHAVAGNSCCQCLSPLITCRAPRTSPLVTTGAPTEAGAAAADGMMGDAQGLFKRVQDVLCHLVIFTCTKTHNLPVMAG